MMREINYFVVHCADTPKGVHFDASDIRRWHTEERGWSDIGYHIVILLDGTIELGRMFDKSGAHVSGFNSKSIGICYIGGAEGEDTRTPEQKESLIKTLEFLRSIFKDAEILGHRDFQGVTKKCPCYDAKDEYKYI